MKLINIFLIVILLYSNNAFSQNQNDSIKYKKIEQLKNETEVCLSGVLGIWVPTGKLSIIGPLPQYGPLIEISKNKYILSLQISLIGIESRISNSFYAKRNNKLEETNVFYGASIGLRIGRYLYWKRNNQIYINSGIRYDGVAVFLKEKEKNLDEVGIETYAINIGLNYRYFFTKFFMGIRYTYNIVDYTRSGIIDLTGNTYSVCLMIGSSFSSKHKKLKTLEY